MRIEMIILSFAKKILLAGIYIHIPFCKQACYYCDFHFSTNLHGIENMVDAICHELQLQANYLQNERVDTIYFGGGTPSLLPERSLQNILGQIYETYPVHNEVEITLEANPDDLSGQKLSELKNAGINRLSIGIQSFDQNHLKYLNRAHNSEEAISCVKKAQDAGISNLTIDLIYGIPFHQYDPWKSDVLQAIDLKVDHISAYCLTIEPQTVFGKWLKQSKIKQVDEELATDHFHFLKQTLDNAGYEHYEISNFCKPGKYSKHNTSYWNQSIYLGVGPSAHSFNKTTRQYNVANNTKYINALTNRQVPAVVETLTNLQKANEMMMTGLRTKWGVSMNRLNSAVDSWSIINHNTIQRYIESGLLQINEDRLYLTENGKLLADQIALDLFLDE